VGALSTLVSMSVPAREQWRDVSAAEFNAFLRDYPRPLDSLPPPTLGQPVVPHADLPENLRAGSNCTKAPWKEVRDPCLLAQLNGPTDSADAKACAKKQKTPPANSPAGYTSDCPAGQTPAKDTRTGMQSCYDPHDRAQLAEHLKECKIRPGDPYAGVGAVVAVP
jgi:hypothetical protein